MFLIVFKTRHALLLPEGRIPCPRINRELDAQQPPNINGTRPRQQPVRDHGSAAGEAQLRSELMHEHAAVAFSPRPPLWQRIVRVHGPATGQNGQGQAIAMSPICPGSVRVGGTSASTNRLQPRTDRESSATRTSAVHRLCVATALSTEFPVHIQHGTAYEFI